MRKQEENNQQYVYWARAPVPVDETSARFNLLGRTQITWPANWKHIKEYREYLKNVLSGNKPLKFNHMDLYTIASDSQQAKIRIESKLRESFIDLCEALFKVKSIPEDPASEIHIFREYGPNKVRPYIPLLSSGQPLYLTEGFDPLGVAISYEEIKLMLLNKKLPQVFLNHPELIPSEVFIPSEKWQKEHKSTKKITYNKEHLTLDKQRELAEGLVNHEEDQDHYSYKLSVSFELANRSHLFPEETSFWIYNSKSFDLESNFPKRLRRFTPVSWGERYFTIGTADQIKDYFKKRTDSKIKAHERSIKSLKSSLTERLDLIGNAPLSFCQ